MNRCKVCRKPINFNDQQKNVFYDNLYDSIVSNQVLCQRSNSL